jgi:hypothetical protein
MWKFGFPKQSGIAFAECKIILEEALEKYGDYFRHICNKFIDLICVRDKE